MGVVTPYLAQARLLRSLLAAGAAAAVEVSSVDGFQGREKELILISTVRANRHGNVGFLADARRANVALTRARRGLLVVGCPRTLRADETWGAWVRWAQESGLEVKSS